MEPLEALLGPRFPRQAALHHFVVVEAASGSSSGSSGSTSTSSSATTRSSATAAAAVWAFDFLPADPLSPVTAAALLSGGAVPGVVRQRPLSGVPRLRCELAGVTHLPDPLAAARAFQRRYDTQLRLLANDCTHHADRLIAHLLQQGDAGA